MRRERTFAALDVVFLVGTVVLGQMMAERHAPLWDLTPTGAHSLSAFSGKALETISGPIDVTAFTDRERRQRHRDILERFARENPDFRFRLVDLDRYPGLAAEAGVDRYGQALLRHDGREVIVDVAREEAIAAGLLRLARGRPVVVAFLGGHGERSPAEASDPSGYGEARRALEEEARRVVALDLQVRRDVPDEVDVVVIAGPRTDLLESEVAALGRYLDRGGAALLLLDPTPLPNVERLAARRGIAVSLDWVVDRENVLFGSEPLVVRVPQFSRHPSVASVEAPGLFVMARSVGAADDVPDAEAVGFSYPEAWAVRDRDRAVHGEPREGIDRPGPVPLVAVATGGSGGRPGRLAVVGDADFASNGFLGLLGNRDLFLDLVAWTTSSDLVVGAHREPERHAVAPLSPLVLSRKETLWIFWLLVVVEPALLLAIGGVVVLRRRRRG